MTTFADELPKDGRGMWWAVEVSFDDFATISYRWATHAGDVESSFFESRVASIGVIQRGLGNNNVPVASTFGLVIDNTDFGADWLVNRATVASQVFKARFRLKVGLWDPAAAVSVVTQKVGTFVCLDLPRRKDGAIQIQLTDDSLGQLADCLVPPSPREWFDEAPGTTNSVFPSNIGNVEPLSDWDLPAPLQFGKPFFTGTPLATFTVDRTPADYDVAGGFAAGHRKYIYPILVCATRDSAAVAATDVTKLFGVYRKDVLTDPRGLSLEGPLSIPEFYGTQRIWKAYKTDTITKDGWDWKLLWVAFDVLVYIGWLDTGRIATGTNIAIQVPSSPEYPPAQLMIVGFQNPSTTFPFAALRTHFAAFDSFIVEGAPGSGITGKADLTQVGDAVNIMQDLVEYYSALGAAAVDTTRFARTKLVTKVLAAGAIDFGAGANQANGGEQQLSDRLSPYGIGTLRKAIAELAASADFDVFMTMDGKVALVTQGADFETQTTTYPTVDESRINNVEDATPSQGERWSPYNRVFLQSRGGQAGPYDDPGGSIASWGRVLPRVLGTKWWWSFNYPMPVNSIVENVWNTRNLEAKVRPVVSFSTDLSILAVELGDYFTMSWTRGGESAVYSSTLWRLESVKINPESGGVDVTAVWMDDLRTDLPFLLDNEDLFLRVAATFGRTATVTSASLVVTFAGGSLVTDGVVAGDILRLQDSTETGASFKRNRDVRIASRDSATQLTLEAGADTDFGPAGPYAVAEWKIVRGATTYHTAVSDPVNYPSGGAMYGKVTDISGVFSDSSTGNKLLDG